jgi:hypothetical protein
MLFIRFESKISFKLCKDVFHDDSFEVQSFTLLSTFPVFTITSQVYILIAFLFLLQYRPYARLYHFLSLVLCYENYQVCD